MQVDAQVFAGMVKGNIGGPINGAFLELILRLFVGSRGNIAGMAARAHHRPHERVAGCARDLGVRDAES